MNASTARRLTRNAAVLAAVPVALLLMTGTASAAGTSGDVSKPQPLSHADQNGTGANPGTLAGCGAYCSTRDGSGSLNGRSDNTQSNKPCAGCVGKADNKNPQGQAPSGPVDHNAGYECDRNQGIGQGNPAHTGCTAPVVTPPVVTPPAVTPPAVTPPAVTPPAVTPPAVAPPVCATDASMAAGAQASCSPAAAGSGSVTPGSGTPGTTTPGTTTPSTTVPGGTPTGSTAPVSTTGAPAGNGAGTVTTPTTATPTTPATTVGDPATAGSGTVSGQSVDSPVVLAAGAGTAAAVGGGSAAAAQSSTGLPFTGDRTGQLALFGFVLLSAGGGLVVGARRV